MSNCIATLAIIFIGFYYRFWRIDWLIDLNSKSNRLGLFYAWMLSDPIHRTFILTCLCSCFLVVFIFIFFNSYSFIYLFCTRSYQIRIISKQIYLTIYGTLSCTTISGESGLGSNGNKRVLHTLQISWTGASPWDAKWLCPGHPVLLGRRNLISPQWRYIQFILSLFDRFSLVKELDTEKFKRWNSQVTLTVCKQKHFFHLQTRRHRLYWWR